MNMQITKRGKKTTEDGGEKKGSLAGGKIPEKIKRALDRESGGVQRGTGYRKGGKGSGDRRTGRHEEKRWGVWRKIPGPGPGWRINGGNRKPGIVKNTPS